MFVEKYSDSYTAPLIINKLLKYFIVVVQIINTN